MTPEYTAYIAVGSNMDPEKHIRRALELLLRQVELAAISTFYETDPILAPGERPVRRSAQNPAYWNGVWAVRTAMDPAQLKKEILRPIEETLGRQRNQQKYAPRTIDLDLILVDGLPGDDSGIAQPHPEIRERPFVAIPLLEISPDLILPDTGERLGSLPIIRQAESMVPLTEYTRLLRSVLRKQG